MKNTGDSSENAGQSRSTIKTAIFAGMSGRNQGLMGTQGLKTMPSILVFVAVRGEVDDGIRQRLLIEHVGEPLALDLVVFNLASNALVFARELLALNAAPLSIGIMTGENSPHMADNVREVANWLPVNFIGVCSTTQSLIVRNAVSEYWLKDMGVVSLPKRHAERFYAVQRIGSSHRDFMLEQWDRCQLPGMVNSFIGRHDEVEELRTLLNDWSIVTIKGLTGIGKSALALATGILIDSEYPEGCFLIRVDHCESVNDVLVEIAKQTAATSPSGTNLVQRIAEGLKGSTVLLILDNCDHLVAGLRKICEELVSQCRSISILVTSVRPLDSANEHVFELGGMDTNVVLDPGIEVEEHARLPDAVRLFFDRAQASKPNFKENSKNVAAVTELCRLLDGVPLAIEMVASRLKSWTLDRIQTNLLGALTNDSVADGRRREGRSFADALAWSLESVPHRQLLLLEQLSLFKGCFSYETCRDVWLASGDDDTIFQMLFDTLIEQGFMIESVNSYRVVYPVKISILERLRRSVHLGEMKERYIAGMDSLAIKVSKTYEYNEPKARGLFEMHHEDMMHALELAMQLPKYRANALSLIEQLPKFWIRKPNCDDIEDFLVLVLENFAELPPVAEARIRNFLGSMYYARHEIARSLEQYTKSLAILESENHTLGVAAAKSNIALAFARNGDYPRAFEYFESSISNARKTGDPRFLAQFLINYASAFTRSDYLNEHSLDKEADLNRVEQMATEIARLTSVNNDAHIVQSYHHLFGEVAMHRSNYIAAQNEFTVAAKVSFESGLMKESCQALDRLAEISIMSGDYASAAIQLGFSTNVRVVCSNPRDSHVQSSFNKTIRTLRERFSDEELQELMQRGAVAKITEIVE